MRHFLQSSKGHVAATESRGLKIAASLVLAVVLGACGTSPSSQPPVLNLAPEAAPRTSLVFIIHGDGDYRYHDARGDAHQADATILAQARTIAEQNTAAEVFIFHQIERRHVLFLIPRKDGRAYHYRNGRLLHEESYWRDQGDSRFDPEMRLYQQYAAMHSRPSRQLFLYFGHEIPEMASAGYDASSPKRMSSIDDLAAAVRSVAAPSERVDLLALATCFGGTPRTIGALAPHARFIVASPDDLHLSYFDLAPLTAFDLGEGDAHIKAFANHFAQNAFEKLTREVLTQVSIVVYDAGEVGTYVDAVSVPYERALAVAAAASPAIRRCDCAEDSSFVLPEMKRGLTVYDRAPRFGRDKQRAGHSGWQCVKSGAPVVESASAR